MEPTDERRRALQQDAFGGAASDEARRAALDGLRRLDSRPDPAPDTPRVASQRRLSPALLIIATAVALVVGLGAGWAIGHSTGARTSTAASQPSASGDPAATSRLAAGDPPVDSANLSPTQQADALLAQSRADTDALPELQGTDSQIDASTSHLVATSAQGERLFITKAAGAHPGFCLVTVTVEHDFGEATGYVRCVSTATFAKRGVSLTSAGYTAVWSGGDVTVTVTNGQGG